MIRSGSPWRCRGAPWPGGTRVMRRLSIRPGVSRPCAREWIRRRRRTEPDSRSDARGRGHVAVSRFETLPNRNWDTGWIMSTPDTLHLATPRSHSVLRRQRSTLTRAHSVSLPVQNMLAVCPLSSGLAVGTGQFSWSCFLQFVPLRPPTLIARASAQRRAPRRGPASSQTSPRSSPRRPADQT